MIAELKAPDRFPRRVASVVMGIIASIMFVVPSAVGAVTPPPPMVPSHTLVPTAPVDATVWRSDLPSAMAAATLEYKPVLILFSSPDCAWCARLKRDTLTDPEVKELLRHFALVECDTTRDPKTAYYYGVRSLPTTIILSSDGTTLGGVQGYISAEQMKVMLTKAINPSALSIADTDVSALRNRIARQDVKSEEWPLIMEAMGQKTKRQPLHDAIVDLNPFPGSVFTNLLVNPRLVVRLGALEILEEMAGDSFGFDPWQGDAESKINDDAMSRWAAWVSGISSNSLSLFTPLNPVQFEEYLQDVVSGGLERATRASGMLRRGGPEMVSAVESFIAAHPELTLTSRTKLRELRYALLLPPVKGLESAAVAHRLVYGSVDMRQQMLTDLEQAGSAAVPVLQDYLSDPDPIIRESAVDAMVKVSGRGAVETIRAHMDTEQDLDVLYACIRALGTTQSKKAIDALKPRLDHPNEDIVVITLKSLGELGSDAAVDAIAKSLKDSRWRVRVAALEAVKELKLPALSDQVTGMLKDSDDFVRTTALDTLVHIAEKKSVKTLQTLYMEDDALKGAIVAAYASMNAPYPAAFWDGLEKKDPDVILAVLNALQEDEGLKEFLSGPGQVSALRLLGVLLRQNNTDVVNATLRLVARSGLTHPFLRGRLVDTFHRGDAERIRTVVEALELPEKDATVAEFYSADAVDATNLPAAAGGDLLRDLDLAFSPEKPVDGVGASTKTETSVVDVIRALEDTLGKTQEPELRHRIALKLAALGNPRVLPVLAQSLAESPAHEREEIAEALSGNNRDGSLEMLKLLLKDSSGSVREAAARSCARNAKKKAFLVAILDELTRPGTELSVDVAYDALVTAAQYGKRMDSHDVINVVMNSRSGSDEPTGYRASVLNLLKPGEAPVLQTVGIVLLENVWQAGDDKQLQPFLRSDDPYIRRAAYHALCSKAPAQIEANVSNLVSDTSEYVRMVLPAVKMDGRATWVHMLDAEHSRPDYSYSWRSSGDRRKHIPQVIRDGLTQLTKDPVPAVRLQACFALLSNFEPVDLVMMTTTLEALPDRESATEWLDTYIRNNYRRLGKDFMVLLPYLSQNNGEEDSTLTEIRKHFGLGDETGLASVSIRAWTNRVSPVATFEAVEEPVAQATPETSRRLKVVFFMSPGCGDCARVERLLEDVRNQFPWLALDEYNIHKVAAVRLNEALCGRFGVPATQRQVAPILFAEGGFLVKSDITPDRLQELLSRSASLPVTDWSNVSEPDLETAGSAITERGHSFSIWLVIGYALLDGINPCAFATIIFLISYLQVTRRTPGEVARVALAFIVGVFIAYLSIGLGLAELLTRLMFIQMAAHVLDWLMAVVAFVLIILNVRDGVLCLRGRMQDMTLQLPGTLKQGIHTVIRHASRQAHFIIAAFFMGLVVSVLELACTGQMYGPTIAYIVRTQGPLTSAFPMLLLYNAAFVLPLVIIFGLSYTGMKAEAFIRILQRHAALVKFLTALLFLALFIILLRGSGIDLSPWLARFR